MSDFEMRAYALACSAYTGAAATPLPDGPPQAAGAPSSSPRAPYGAMTTGEAEAWRTGWRVAQSAILDRVSRQYPSLAAEIAGMRMPAPMQEPDGLSERGA